MRSDCGLVIPLPSRVCFCQNDYDYSTLRFQFLLCLLPSVLRVFFFIAKLIVKVPTGSSTMVSAFSAPEENNIIFTISALLIDLLY